jgi:hypothetical protein
MAKFKILVIKLLMKNGKMADHGTIHDEGAFNRPTSELEKEKFIEKASKADLDEAVKKAKSEAEESKKEAGSEE